MRLSALVQSLSVLLQLTALSDGYFGLTSRNFDFAKSVLARCERNKTTNSANSIFSDRCGSLCLYRNQRQICREHFGYGESLEEALRMSLMGCQREMKDNRWNCSSDLSRSVLLDKPYRETAFLHAVNSASLAHSFARACSRGQLPACGCANKFNEPEDPNHWRWGGCGDNIAAAEFLTRNLSRTARRTRDGDLRRIDRHNFEVGLQVVRKRVKKICKCHGISGSCAMKSCVAMLQSFPVITKSLHRKYRTAVKVTRPPHVQSRPDLGSPTGFSSSRSRPRTYFRQLIFRLDSLNFCLPSDWSLGVAGRECVFPEPGLEPTPASCEVLCCDRGYQTQWRKTQVKCDCHVDNLEVICDTCEKDVIKHFCN